MISSCRSNTLSVSFNTREYIIPFRFTKGYNPKDFELLLRQTQAVMENGKFPSGPPLFYFGDVQ
jgi:hypothetical protein